MSATNHTPIHRSAAIGAFIYLISASVPGLTIHENGLGPMVLGIIYEQQVDRLEWGEPDQSFMSGDQLILIYEAQGVSFFYQLDRTSQNAADAISNSTLSEIVITSSVFTDDQDRGVGRPCAADSLICSAQSLGVCFECAEDGFINKVRIKGGLSENKK